MPRTSYADIIKPEKVAVIIGKEWTNRAKIVTSGVATSEPMINQGIAYEEIYQSWFTNSSGQALKFGDTISKEKKEQVLAKTPRLWRYTATEVADAEKDIEEKEARMVQASVVQDITKSSTQYVDDSAAAILKGIGAVLTSNQYDSSSSTISDITPFADLYAKFGEKADKMNGSAVFGNSVVYWKLVKLGMVAATSNTFGNTIQDEIVRSGKLPQLIGGITFIMSDKFSAVTTNQYYLYFVGRDAMVLRGTDKPYIESERKQNAIATNFKVSLSYSLGVRGMSWAGSFTEDISDTDIETSSNWELKAGAQADVGVGRLLVKTA